MLSLRHAMSENPKDSPLAEPQPPITLVPMGPAPEPPPNSKGDFGAFFQKTLGPLRRYIAGLIGHREAQADDIAQDAYAKVFQVMQDKPIEHPQALLYRTAHNLAVDELRLRTRMPIQGQGDVSAALSQNPPVEAIVMAREELTLLERAIAQLPEQCRQVLYLRMLDRLSQEEVGLRLGLTRKQVEKRLHKALVLLHAEMNFRS